MSRQEVVWVEWVPDSRLVTKGRFAPLKMREAPTRVWTLFRHTDPAKVPETPFSPVHLDNAFLEDRVHDWNWQQGWFRYYTRVVDHGCWLLLEF